jgi:hypothetical protein
VVIGTAGAVVGVAVAGFATGTLIGEWTGVHEWLGKELSPGESLESLGIRTNTPGDENAKTCDHRDYRKYQKCYRVRHYRYTDERKAMEEIWQRERNARKGPTKPSEKGPCSPEQGISGIGRGTHTTWVCGHARVGTIAACMCCYDNAGRQTAILVTKYLVI